MTNDLVLRGPDLNALAELGAMLRDSGYFPDTGKVAQAAVKVLAGRELGLGPVASMRGLHIVEGRIELSADLLAQRVKTHGRYDYRVERLDAEECRLIFFEAGAVVGKSTFSIGDAAQAELTGKKAWQRYPRNMLFNRALTNGVAWFCPDVAGSMPYVVAGGLDVDLETGEIIEAPIELEPVGGSAIQSSEVSPRDGMGEMGGEVDADGATTRGAASAEPEGSEADFQGEDATSDPERTEGNESPSVEAGGERTVDEHQGAGKPPVDSPPPASTKYEIHPLDSQHRWRKSTTMPGYRYCATKSCSKTERIPEGETV